MSYERIMGLHVVDDEMYQKYREGMEPILISIGGSFGFDFKISEVLRSKTDNEINRVFTIEFPSKKEMEDFFSRSDYMEVKSRYLDASVKSKTVISMNEISGG
ncbi:MAG: DUF1330 domain-containing protein [Candidatus Thiodiazotropha sp. DIVDIV]